MAEQGFWQQFLPGAFGAYGYSQLVEDFEDQRDDIRSTVGGLQDFVQQNAQFQPYALRGPMGKSSYSPNGLNMQLNPQMQGIQDMFFGGGQDLIGRSMQDTAGREEDIYQRIRAAQMPGEQRALGQLQSRAAAQGRSGMGGNQYGGTPEQLAFEKARQESMLNARLGSMDQARSEVTDQYTRGLGMMGAGYQPMNQLMQQGAMGMDMGQLLQRPQENMLQYYTNLGLGGLGTEVNMSNIMGNAFGNMIGAGQGLFSGLGGSVDEMGWMDTLRNIIGL